jgi:dolichol-phosphate mannosyltransferase
VLGEVRLYGELHRFVPVLAAGRGYRVGEISVNHRARRFGQSKYGLRRFVNGFLDLLTVKFLTGYGQRPQHLLGTIGLACFVPGTLWAVWLALYWIISRLGFVGLAPIQLHESPAPLYAIGLLLVGAQFMSIGFLAELFIAYRQPDQKPYSIADRTPEK